MKFKFKKIKSNLTDNQGFTLIELLVATVIMSIVVTLSGTAFVALLEKNQEEEFEVQRRTNLNRALDYMANEIKRSNKIEAGDPAAGEVFKLTTPRPPANLFTNPYTNMTIVYSVADGSQTILRDNDVLVDAIQAPENPPTCPTGSTLTPALTPPERGDGFYACIYDSGNKADLYLYGKLSDNEDDPNFNKPLEVKRTVFTRSSAVN
jgi:prepilin-type N-terminal cleavage/methylation domain-containing protein